MAIGSHTIPRFYLEQFADPPKRRGRVGKVWVYQKGKQPQQRATDSQGYENGYFGYLRSDGTLDESLEKQLAKLEDECNEILVCAKSELCDLRSLTNRNRLAFYVVLLFQRSTSRKNFSANNWRKIKEPYLKLAESEEYVHDLAEHFCERGQGPITPAQVQEMIRSQAEKMSQQDSIRNAFVMDLLSNVEVFRDEFVSRPWQVWEAPEGVEFVTSDTPMVSFVRLTDEMWHPGHGFREPNVIIAFPLAPKACLTIGIVGQEFVRVGEEQVLRMNEIVIRCSDRFVYAKTPSDRIANMIEEFGTTSVPGKTAFIGQMPDEKKIEEHMRRTMGIRRRKAS
jgi:hypothetical protein